MERQAAGARVHTPTHTPVCTRTRRSGQCQLSSPLKLQCAQCSACSLLRRCPQAMEIDRIQESRALLLKEHSNALAITQRVRLRRKAVRPSAPTRADGRGGAGLFVCAFVCLSDCLFVRLFVWMHFGRLDALMRIRSCARSIGLVASWHGFGRFRRSASPRRQMCT